jgi:alpha-D-ribose 1-methylphosphonate 5-phosphate C-P lyase
VTWIVAVAIVAVIWAHRLAGAQMPIPYRWTMIVLGYAGAIMGAREFLADIDAKILDGSTVLFALSVYVGAALMAVGASRMSRSE